MQKITTFLMFEGKAEQAMTYYTSIFDRAKITNIVRYGPEGPGPEGTVMQAVFELAGQEFMAFDSFVQHQFTFTPSISLYVNFDNEAELVRAFEQLSHGGAILMPLDAYPFSQKFGWVADQFGVSWQLNLAQTLQAAE